MEKTACLAAQYRKISEAPCCDFAACRGAIRRNREAVAQVLERPGTGWDPALVRAFFSDQELAELPTPEEDPEMWGLFAKQWEPKGPAA